MPTTAASTKRSNQSSAAIARVWLTPRTTSTATVDALDSPTVLCAEPQFGPQILDHLIACAGLPAPAAANRRVFDLRMDFESDEYRPWFAEDVGEVGRKLPELVKREGSRVTGATGDHVIGDIVGVRDRLAAGCRVATVVDEEMVEIRRPLLGNRDEHAEAHQNV